MSKAAERLLLERDHAFVERLGIGIACLLHVEQRQAIERGADIAVLGPEHSLFDGERALV